MTERFPDVGPDSIIYYQDQCFPDVGPDSILYYHILEFNAYRYTHRFTKAEFNEIWNIPANVCPEIRTKIIIEAKAKREQFKQHEFSTVFNPKDLWLYNIMKEFPLFPEIKVQIVKAYNDNKERVKQDRIWDYFMKKDFATDMCKQYNLELDKYNLQHPPSEEELTRRRIITEEAINKYLASFPKPSLAFNVASSALRY